eukprot:6210831-Pleurochrysis_carterae.AAC.1
MINKCFGPNEPASFPHKTLPHDLLRADKPRCTICCSFRNAARLHQQLPQQPRCSRTSALAVRRSTAAPSRCAGCRTVPGPGKERDSARRGWRGIAHGALRGTALGARRELA